MADDERKRLVRMRGVIRGSVTRVKKVIDEQLEEEEPNIETLEQAASLLDSKEIELKDLDKQIELLLAKTMTEEELVMEAEAAMCEIDRIVLARSRANRYIDKVQKPLHTTIPVSSRGPTPPIGRSPEEERGPSVRLPKLELKKYNGEISQWQNFWGQYESSIHHNRRLDDKDKFSYLRGLLEGPAARAIAGLSLSDANYNTAIGVLKKKFGKRGIIVSEHKNNLLKLPKVNEANDINGLKLLYESCEVEVRSLEALEVPQEQYGAFLTHILGGLLPRELALQFTRSRPDDDESEWEVEEMLEFLKKEISCLEKISAIKRIDNLREPPLKRADKQSDSFNRNNFSAGKNNFPTVAAFHVGVNNNNNNHGNNTPRFCPFCDSESHAPINCNLSITERRGIVLQKRLCFICLRGRHHATTCYLKSKRCAKCSRKHNLAVCDYQENGVPIRPHQQQNAVISEQTQNPEQRSNNAQTVPRQINMAAAVSSMSKTKPRAGEILLQTAKANIIGPSGIQEKTRVFFDSGSQASFITEELSRKLKLEVIGEEALDVHKFEGETPMRSARKKVRVTLHNPRDPSRNCVITAFEARTICGAIFSVPSETVVNEMTKRGLEVADPLPPSGEFQNESPIEILIGSECFWEIASGKTERLGKALVALETQFGWIVQGPTTVTPTSTAKVNSVTIMHVAIESNVFEEEELLSKQISSTWELDGMGIIDEEDTQRQARIPAFQQFEDNITFNNGRYQVSLPWKTEKEKLGDNFDVASKRTENLLKRLREKPEIFERYHGVILEQIEAGIIEEVPQEELIVSDPNRPLYYIPHRGVFREDEQVTTKLRVVNDASSHAAGFPSLNDCLDAGPSLLPDLFDILIGFRENPIALTADIEKAFHQIEINPEDRDALRFIWVKGTSPRENSDMKIYRFTRVPFGVNASPFLLTATIKHHAKKYENIYANTSAILQKKLYVDDLASGAKNTEMTLQLGIEATEILKAAGMNLRKWRSNSRELKERLGETSAEEPSGSVTKSQSVKVLGLSWNEKDDHLHYDVSALLDFMTNNCDTKRWILKAVARIFDPLGFITPFTIRAKMLLQELWEAEAPWDKSLSQSENHTEVAAAYAKWCEELPDLRNIRIPRFYFKGALEDLSTPPEVHCFVDASTRAYAVVIYLRYEDKQGDYRTAFVTSKSRVAPLKKLKLPRLELMSAVIGAKLVKRVMETFTIKPKIIRMWTDSMVALHWIRGSADRWKPFIGNRVREIQSISDPNNWSHCAGKENPADLPTRGKTMADLVHNQFWWHGPKWLQEKNRYVTVEDPAGFDEKEIESELRPKHKAVLVVSANQDIAEPVLNLKKYSKLMKIYRITAWMYRFLNNTKSADKIKGPLTAEEILIAEKYWIAQAQRESYSAELNDLKNGHAVNDNSAISPLTPFLDKDGLMSVGGRLTGAHLTYREQHPWLLSSQHQLAKLMAMDHHQRLNHAGVSDTLGEIREYFWIPKARQMVKRELSSCQRCKLFRAKPSAAIMAPLPPSRTTPAPVFEVCGVDFCGPLFTKEGNKCYVALYTCAVTRAIHLELVPNLTADSFLMSFRRFIARRGLIKIMYSDNAKTFKRAEADLCHLWDNLRSQEVADFFSARKISWKYIADRAAWWGGFWERLVGSVKIALRKVIGLSKLTFEELGTILAEVEATVNSRPITYVYQDASEPVPLTPSHFLVGRRLTVLPSRIFPHNEPQLVTRLALTKRWQYRQTLMERFWARWKQAYLLELRSAHHRTKCQPTPELSVGDIVLVEEARLPRLMWKMCRVSEAVKGRDGVVRSCVVKLPNGKSMRRPVQLLYHLEC